MYPLASLKIYSAEDDEIDQGAGRVLRLIRHLMTIHRMAEGTARDLARSESRDVRMQRREGQFSSGQQGFVKCEKCEGWYRNIGHHLKKTHPGIPKRR